MSFNGTDVLIGKMRFCDLRADQRKKAVKATTIASQTAPRTRNKLTAMRPENRIVEPVKAFAECLCEPRIVDGRKWLVMSPDCSRHGVFHENARLDRKGEPVVGAGRDGRKRAKEY